MVLPEIVGEDEQAVEQANAFVEGGSRLAAPLGPSTAGLLIVAIGSVFGSAIGLRPTLLLATVGGLAGSLWLLPSPIPGLRALPDATE